MKTPTEFVIKPLLFVLFAPLLLALVGPIAFALFWALLPWLLLFGVIIGVAAGATQAMFNRRALASRENPPLPQEEPPLGRYRVRRPATRRWRDEDE